MNAQARVLASFLNDVNSKDDLRMVGNDILAALAARAISAEETETLADLYVACGEALDAVDAKTEAA